MATSAPSKPANRLVLNLIAGGTVGLIAILTAASFGTVIFAGEFAPALPFGIGLLLLSTTIVSTIMTGLSSYAAIVGTISEVAIPVLSLVARQVVAQMPNAPFEDKLLTLTATIILNSVVSGALFFALGWFKLGGLIRFIPYPVVGGFLAGTGALLIQGAVQSIDGLDLAHFTISALFEPAILLQWVPGTIFAIVLFVIPLKVKHPFVTPGLFVASLLLFYAALALIGTSIAEAGTKGLLLDPLPPGSLFEFSTFTALGQANWSVVAQQIPSLAALWLIDALALLLNANGIELVVSRDLDLNHELKTAGIATIAAGAGGGIGGFASSTDLALINRLGGTGRLTGWVVAGLSFAMLVGGASLLSLFPKFILVGIPLLLGIEFFYEWLYLAWFKFSRSDYAIIVLIVLITAMAGYLQGIAVGLIAAIVLFVVNYSQLSVTKRISSGAYYHSNVMRSSEEMDVLEAEGDRTYILELQGLIFFGTANKLLTQVQERLDSAKPIQFVVLDFRLVSGLDASAVLSFAKLKQVAHLKQVHLVFTHLSKQATRRLEQGDCLEPDDPLCHVFDDLDRGLEWCEQQILQASYLSQTQSRSLVDHLKADFSDPNQVDRLMTYLSVRQLEADEYLFHQGDRFDGLYFVGAGQVSVVLELGNDQTKRIRTYTMGNTIGEMGLYRQTPRMASVVADTTSTVYFLSTEAFEQIETTDPLLASNVHRFIVNLLAERLHHREQELKHLLQS